MNKKNTKKALGMTVGGAAALSLLIGIPAFAATGTSTPSETGLHTGHFAGKGGFHKFSSSIIGTVTAVNGTTLSVTGIGRDATTTYSVDASNATVTKGFGKTATTIAVSDIAVNDRVIVQGTVSGTSVTATKINDGLPQLSTNSVHSRSSHASSMGLTFGTVASISGDSFTLTHVMREATTSVTVTTTDTTVWKKNGKPDTSSDLAVGQLVVVMGTKDSSGNVNPATSVSIMVRTPRNNPPSSPTSSSTPI